MRFVRVAWHYLAIRALSAGGHGAFRYYSSPGSVLDRVAAGWQAGRNGGMEERRSEGDEVRVDIRESVFAVNRQSVKNCCCMHITNTQSNLSSQ